MAEHATVWAATSFFAAAICFSLAASVYRHAERSFEVNNVIAISLFLALRSVIFLVHAFADSLVASGDTKTHASLVTVACLVQILMCAAIVHLLVLSTRRLICESGELVGNSAVFGIARSELLHRLVALAIWGFAALAIGEHAYRLSWTLPTSAASRMPMQAPFFGIPAGFVLRFLAGIGICAQMVAMGLVFRRWRARWKKSWFVRWQCIADPGMRGRDDESSSCFLTIYLLLDFSVDRGTQINVRDWFDIVWFLLPVMLILPMIHYKMRFIFFDVLVRRGLLLALLVTTSSIYFYWCLLPLRHSLSSENGAAGIAILSMGSVLFTLLCVLFYGRMSRAIDHILFRRADYARLVPEISSALQEHVEAQSLLAYLTGKLKSVMEAERVIFSPPGPEDGCDFRSDPGFEQEVQRQSDTATVAVKAGERLFGRLQFGKRQRGQKYQSEDLGFLQTIADQSAGMLQNIELREERERQRNREQQLRELAAQAELKALKAQINPHFLFNALNSLADLTRENPEAAEKEILHLSEVFRYALQATQRESVKLGEEADFLRSYLSVERIRFEDRLQFEIDIPEELRGCRIPPMIIQPLVENAVKHGITRCVAGGRILIAARLNGSNLRIRVEDNGAGFDPRSRPSPGHNGIGLSNVRSRIESLNPASSLQISSEPGLGTRISFEIPVAAQDSAVKEV